ncbi:hypothetical protein DFH28DRAFT_885553 [Melampsora americana]|nr:hypothetical protein DFH28DRAFT_885553 [Melampsora americana]
MSNHTQLIWNVGHLTHPNKPWGGDGDSQAGMKTYLEIRSHEEELQAIAHEIET